MERELPIGTGAAWECALECWDARLDPAEGRRAARAFEDLAAADASDARAFAWCARAWYYEADYEERPKERLRLFERGARRGRQALELHEEPGALFWTAACLGGSADLQGAVRRAVQAPEILKCLARLREREPDYYHGALNRYLGQALVRQPGLAQRVIGAALPEFGAESLMRRLEASIERDPPFVLTHQTLAQLAFAADGDRATADRMRGCIDALDLDATPNLAPENHRDAPRARALLDAIVGDGR